MIPSNHGRPSRTRAIVPWIALFVAAGAAAALFLSPPRSGMGEPATADSSAPRSLETAGETCLRLSENPSEYLSDEATQRRTELRLASCKKAFATEPGNTHYKVAVARAMPIAQRAESLALLREAAAQNDAEAWLRDLRIP